MKKLFATLSTALNNHPRTCFILETLGFVAAMLLVFYYVVYVTYSAPVQFVYNQF